MDKTNGSEKLISSWYKEAFPDDDLGKEINAAMNFGDLVDALNKGEDVYDTLGVDDSVVRERVFHGLADAFVFSYDDVYNKWLHKDKAEDLVIKSDEEAKVYKEIKSALNEAYADGESIFESGNAIYKVVHEDDRYLLETFDAETAKHLTSGGTDWVRIDLGDRTEAEEYLFEQFGNEPKHTKRLGNDSYEYVFRFKPDKELTDETGLYHSDSIDAEIKVKYRSGETLTFDDNALSSRQIFVGIGGKYGFMRDFENIENGKYSPEQIQSLKNFVEMQEKEAVQIYPHMAWPHNTSYRLEFKNGMSVEMDSEAVLKAWDRSNGARLNIKSDQDAFGRPFSFTAKMSDLAEVIDMDTGEMLYTTPERADARRLMAEKEQAINYPRSCDRELSYERGL